MLPFAFAGVVGWLVWRNRVALGLSPVDTPPTSAGEGAGGSAASGSSASNAAGSGAGAAASAQVAAGRNVAETRREPIPAVRTAAPDSAREAAASGRSATPSGVEVADNPFGRPNGTKLDHHQWNYLVGEKYGGGAWSQPDPQQWAGAAAGVAVLWIEYRTMRERAGYPLPVSMSGARGMAGGVPSNYELVM
jgi:hypothetical protein